MTTRGRTREITRPTRAAILSYRQRSAAAAPRLAAILLLATLFLTFLAVRPQVAHAQKFPDVLPSNTAYDAIEAFASRGVISGSKDGLFRPNDPLARAQAAKILVGWKGVTPAASSKIAFTDLDSTYLAYVETAAVQGWVNGYSTGAFKPYKPLTREQMAIIVIRCLGSETDAQKLTAEHVSATLKAFKDLAQISGTARPYVALAVEWGLFSGDTEGRFKPASPITRAQFCMVLARADARVTLIANRGELAHFMDTYFFQPRNSPITGEMIIQNTEWYGVPPLVQLVILTAETALGDPEYGGELARNYNFGCLKYGSTDNPWGELSTGSVSVAGSNWYSFPDAQIGMMAFGRYLKAGPSSSRNGLYLECLTSNPIDWCGFASVYFGANVSGFEAYVDKLHGYEDKYRAKAAEHGLTI